MIALNLDVLILFILKPYMHPLAGLNVAATSRMLSSLIVMFKTIPLGDRYTEGNGECELCNIQDTRRLFC